MTDFFSLLFSYLRTFRFVAYMDSQRRFFVLKFIFFCNVIFSGNTFVFGSSICLGFKSSLDAEGCLTFLCGTVGFYEAIQLFMFIS